MMTGPLEMNPHHSKAQHCLDMANHIRTLAARESDQRSRTIMLSLAEQYEELWSHLTNHTVTR
jgi:hypothetical protein